jgi:HSP20 family molecular chaperone IbpA
MAVMRLVGGTHPLPLHANVCETESEYLVELDVGDFTPRELTVEATGPQLTIRGEQLATDDDDGKSFRLREQLQESFRLPDDVDLDALSVRYLHGALHIRAPKRALVPRTLPIATRSAVTGNPDAVPC